jgi:hypothetical protein
MTMIDSLRQMWKETLVISYEGESVSRSQVDIRRKTCDIRTGKKNKTSASRHVLDQH